MNTAIERLLSLSVDEVMSRHVIQVSSHQSMAEAAEVLDSHGITGAPVVDERGHCVGVLSGSDYVRREKGRENTWRSTPAAEEHYLLQETPESPFRIEAAGCDTVDRYMTAAVPTVSSRVSLLEAARMMSCGHVHRLLVVDEHKYSLGVVSSLDIVAALVRAVEE